MEQPTHSGFVVAEGRTYPTSWIWCLSSHRRTRDLKVGLRSLRVFTPALFPVLYAIMVFLEAPVSGTSTNPARSLGPAVIAGEWRAWWVYWVGPLMGMVSGVLLYRLSWLRELEIEVAKVYHFEHDRYGIFRRSR